MVSNVDNKWIRIFDIPETSTHKRGFTLYKIISMLYPESSPDAVIKITVWKRYNEFKKLHREIKVKYRLLNLKEKFPNLPGSAYFKRFNSDIIKERQSTILSFLEFVANVSELYTSPEFVNFFKNSQTPLEVANSTISTIRAELNLPEETEYFPFHVPSSDEECTISDTDSITTMSSSMQNLELKNILSISNNKLTNQNDNFTSKTTLNDSHDSISISTTTISNESAQAEIDTFYASIGNDISEYIVEASHHINLAVQFESDQKYEEAFNEYKTGIDILLCNVKEDKNIDRRQMVKFQIDKYLLRAEKIYNLHLSNEMKNLKQIANKYNYTERSKLLIDLHKYKVLKVIGTGMLALHSEFQKLYYIKVIQKTTIFSCDHLILPDDVPFMIKLESYYISENAIFLILEYCDGTKLCDYIQQRCRNTTTHFYDTFDKCNFSDNESEGSYTDLINEYTTFKAVTTNIDSLNKTINSNNYNDESDELEFRKCILNETEQLEEAKEIDYNSRKSSILSQCDDFDLEQLVPIKYVVKWSAQILLALEKLHSLGVICNNLHIKNLLINDKEDIILTYQCKIADNFIFKENNYFNLPHTLHNLHNISKATDIWSFGIILYELLIGMPLIETHPEGLSPHTILYIPKYVTAEGRSLLKQLLSFETTECGLNKIEDIKMHPFYNSISWESLLSHNQCNH